jgi:hypothetical protein
MSAVTDSDELSAIAYAKATSCTVTTYHVPVSVRFVIHHIQPQEAGGQTVPENLVDLCDNCHMTCHRLMWYLRLKFDGKTLTAAQQSLLDKPPRANQLKLAQAGFDACVAAGTVDKIPNEG